MNSILHDFRHIKIKLTMKMSITKSDPNSSSHRLDQKNLNKNTPQIKTKTKINNWCEIFIWSSLEGSIVIKWCEIYMKCFSSIVINETEAQVI